MSDDRIDITLRRRAFELNVAIALPARGVVALLGPSGSGKSTLLRAVAGIESAATGRIRVADRDWLDTRSGIDLAPQKRRVGMVFQDYALFEHMTVAANVGFGVPRRRRAQVVARLTETFRLQGLADRRPSQLSGGQRQRVALARALAPDPDMLLLDEPLSAVDVHLRERLRVELQGLFQTLDTPTLLVSHDLEEARQLADYVGVLVDGRIQRYGTTREVFDHPGTVAAAQVLGWRNLLPVRGWSNRAVTGSWGRIRLLHDASLHTAMLGIRPEKVSILPAGEGDLDATVVRIADKGAIHEVHCCLVDGTPFYVQRLWSDPLPRPGSPVGLGLPLQHLVPLVDGDGMVPTQLHRLGRTLFGGVQSCPSAVAVS